MDMNEYAFEIVVRERLAEMRAAAERSRRLEGARPVSPSLPVALGQALMRIGGRLRDVRDDALVRIGWGDAVAARRRSTDGTVHG